MKKSEMNISKRDQMLLFAIALVVIILTTFYSAAASDFLLWDDYAHVVGNRLVNPPSISNLGPIWSHPYQYLYVPVSYTVFNALAWMARISKPDFDLSDSGSLLNPHVFHTFNLVLHIASALILFGILRRLTKRDLAAFLGALLFAFHPLQTESVAWISELRGLLSGFFGLSALAIYARYMDYAAAQKNVEKWNSDRIGYYVPLWILSALAILSKPNAVVLPVLMFLLARAVYRREVKKILIDIAVPLVISAGMAICTCQLQHSTLETKTLLWQKPFIALDALAFYLVKFVFPYHLAPDYAREPHALLAHWWSYFSGVIPLAFFWIAWRLRKVEPHILTGLLFFTIALLPQLGLFDFAYQWFSTVADRYAYLPLAGGAVSLAFVLARAPRGSKRILFAGCWAAALIPVSIYQTQMWSDNMTFFSKGSELSPKSAAMHDNYATVLMHYGKIDAAEEEYRKAIECNPRFSNALIGLAEVYRVKKDLPAAIAELTQALAANPSDERLYFDLGNAYLQSGLNAQAVGVFSSAEKLNPNSAQILNNLGIAHLNLGDYADSISEFEKASLLQPDNPGFLKNLSEAREKQADANKLAAKNAPKRSAEKSH